MLIIFLGEDYDGDDIVVIIADLPLRGILLQSVRNSLLLFIVFI